MSRLRDIQDRVAALLGCQPQAREAIVEGMLHRDPGETTGYWLQLGVAVGIASFGLVLGSTAVVIGAMLIAPLMNPIVRLGMGLAVGSPFLVLRSGGRIVASIVLAVACSSALTAMLPFHETTAEIAARTAPTLLDLLTAAFCALSGAYAAVRPTSDMASTAAGTSIGISLVPPLCASGYGLGTATWSISNGAGLLFLTNFVAIVVVATLTFAAAGFGQVDSATLEREELGGGSNGATLARALASAFASRGGSWLRLAMPLALLCAVYVPLRRALDDLVWQVKVRSTVESALTKLPSRVVQSSIQIQRGEVALGLLVLGNTTDAQRSHALLTDLLQSAGIRPQLEIAAVPDASSFARLEAKIRTPSNPTVPIPHVVDPLVELDASRAAVWSAVERRWPRHSAGLLLSVTIEARSGAALSLRVAHLGAALEPATRELLERVVGEDLRRSVAVASVALPVDELVVDPDTPAAFVSVASLVEVAAGLAGVNICAVQPAQPGSRGRRGSALSVLDTAMREVLARHPRTTLRGGTYWGVRFTLSDCAEPSSGQTLPQ